jgi:hydrogenase expression/formation protein HypC
MCIGIPMQVTALSPGFAQVLGRGETRRVKTSLLPELEVGQWVLVFLDDAREILSDQRALEVNATLDLLAAAMGQEGGLGSSAAAAFDLPSAMDIHALRQLTQA